MKKIIAFILSVITLSTALTATAAEIPRASAPENATAEQITIVENLIGDILDEVNTGAGYGMTSKEHIANAICSLMLYNIYYNFNIKQ